MNPLIECLRVKVIDKAKLKSNHYWIMALVGRMTNLKVLKLHKDSLVSLGADGFKFLQKGLKYFQESGGSLVKLQVSSHLIGNASDEYLQPSLKCLPDLRILKITGTYLTLKDA